MMLVIVLLSILIAIQALATLLSDGGFEMFCSFINLVILIVILCSINVYKDDMKEGLFRLKADREIVVIEKQTNSLTSESKYDMVIQK